MLAVRRTLILKWYLFPPIIALAQNLTHATSVIPFADFLLSASASSQRLPAHAQP